MKYRSVMVFTRKFRTEKDENGLQLKTLQKHIICLWELLILIGKRKDRRPWGDPLLEDNRKGEIENFHY